MHMKHHGTGIPFLAYRSFYTPLNTIERFAGAGYDTICVFPAHTRNSLGEPYSQYDPTWLWYDRIDPTPFDRMAEDILRAMPSARFLLMIDLNSPVWLEHQKAYTCCDSFNNLGRAVHNPEWKEPTENYLSVFLRHAMEKYRDRIAACILACGATDEWYDYSSGTESSDRRAAWRAWQTAHGRPDPIDIPPQSVREHLSHENFLRDPEKDGLAVDYWRFCNESIADTILEFARIARGITGPDVEIGCFYGYILEKSFKTLVSCGHLAYEKVLDCPDIDFLISPGTYVDREMGGGSGFLIPNGTAAVRGKRLLHECDQRTNTYNSYLTPYINLRLKTAWPDEKSTVAGIRREAALGLIKRTHLWWFDMWGDYYQGERVMDTLSRVHELWTRLGAGKIVDVCETAMIVDPDSTYLVNQDHPMTPEMNLGTRNKLNRLGAPFEVYSFFDIPRIPDFERYRFVIFTSLFSLNAEKKRVLDEYVLRDGRTVLWLYGPGICTDGRLDTAACERLCGIPYGKEGLSVRRMDGWTSAYLHNWRDLTPAMLRKLAEESGARLTVDAEIPVYAEGDLLAVHTKEGGRLTVRVDEDVTLVEELFTGSTCAVREGRFEYPFEAPDTALFHLKRTAD